MAYTPKSYNNPTPEAQANAIKTVKEYLQKRGYTLSYDINRFTDDTKEDEVSTIGEFIRDLFNNNVDKKRLRIKIPHALDLPIIEANTIAAMFGGYIDLEDDSLIILDVETKLLKNRRW